MFVKWVCQETTFTDTLFEIIHRLEFWPIKLLTGLSTLYTGLKAGLGWKRGITPAGLEGLW